MSKRLKSKAKAKRLGRKRALRNHSDTNQDSMRAARRRYGQGVGA